MPVELAGSNPLTFRHESGITEAFSGYMFEEDPHTLTVKRRNGCVNYTVDVFTHNASVDALYNAVVGDMSKRVK